ncbi:hypothetical protein [Rhodohalobacter sp. 614A]|uniref:hypothetical protein n=1 Tax=Rhodohalobacter sp. 614A TaxID=2908649 RepID=UPI001F3234A9|nr:hypothetical protein [Rhodohalobacter sp. 614A]
MSNENRTTIGEYSHVSNIDLRDSIDSQIIVLDDLIHGLDIANQQNEANYSGAGIYHAFRNLKAMLEELDNRFEEMQRKCHSSDYQQAKNLVDQVHRLFFTNTDKP